MQCAFTVPLGLLIAVALGSYEPVPFFPAELFIVGGHYLVFILLYGMRLFAVLAGVLILLGVSGLLVIPQLGEISGWLSTAVFLIFAVVLSRAHNHATANVAYRSSRGHQMAACPLVRPQREACSK